jgi:hypothetical protein
MKKLILLLMITAITISAKAQSSKTNVGGIGAGVAEITWINGEPALNIGAYGGVLINQKFLIGASGNNIIFSQPVNGKNEDLRFNYYGLYTEYKLMPKHAVHASIGLTGALGWQENDIINDKKLRKKDGDYTYVIQPKLAVNVKIAKFMQVQAYGSYRITGKTNSVYYSQNNYNGMSAGIGLVFGSF